MNFADAERTLAAMQLAAVMFALGAHLHARDFANVFAQPRSLLVGLGAQWILSPILAWITVRTFGLDAGLAVGLFIVATMPGGPMSALFVYSARGNAALAVGLTLCTTLFSVVAVPALLGLLIDSGVRDEAFPTEHVLFDIVYFLLAPVAVGAALRLTAVRTAAVASKIGMRIGTCLLVVYVLWSLGSGRIRPNEYGFWPAFAIVLFCVLTPQFAMAPFRLLRWPGGDRVAVGVELTIRDIGLAVLIKSRIAPAPEVGADPALYAILFYGGTALISAAGIALVFRFLAEGRNAPAATADESNTGGVSNERRVR